MIDNRTAPYAALVLRLALSFFFFAHLIRKFAVIGLDPWWAGLVKQGYPGVVLGYTVAIELAGAVLLLGIYTRTVSLLALPVLIAVANHWVVRPVCPLDRLSANWHDATHATFRHGRRAASAFLQNALMKISTFFTRCFTWWNGQTFGTQVWTALYGEFVGEDEFGNRYYRTKGGKIDAALGFERRWVIYNGYTEASAIGPAWHGWMHHTVDVPPTQEHYVPRAWQKPHRPNLTGTPAAQRPTGSTLAQGRRPKATGDYKAWVPGSGA